MIKTSMDKRQLHHQYVKLRRLKPWYFLALAAIFLVLAIYGLRQNNLKMIELRDAVYIADEKGRDVEKPLAELRNFVYSHMNTNLSGGQYGIKPPIQLKNRYEKLLAEQKDDIKKQNARITAEAEQTCARQYPAAGLNSPRVACVQEYIRTKARTAGDVPDDLYKFDFASPRWAADFPGISIVLAIISLLVFASLLAVQKWLKFQVK